MKASLFRLCFGANAASRSADHTSSCMETTWTPFKIFEHTHVTPYGSFRCASMILNLRPKTEHYHLSIISCG